jgi:flavin-dependent dehydrogenase
MAGNVVRAAGVYKDEASLACLHDPMFTSAEPADVFIAGAGPAGLAAAIAARRKGLRVTVADASEPPVDKACGEGLMPEGLSALHALGVSIDPHDGKIFRGIRFCEPGRSAAAKFPGAYGIGVRRPLLHARLMRHAEDLGVRIFWRARVQPCADGSIAINGEKLRSRWIIGADGQNSAIRAWAGLDANRTSSLRFGFRRHFRVAPWTDHVEVHWGERCQVYITPVSTEEICVAMITRHRHVRYDPDFAGFPEVASRLAGAEPSTSLKGAVTVTRRFKSVTRGNVALIGEASGSVDAITGEGMSLAFQQALALGEALAVGDLALYQPAHRRIGRLPEGMAHLILQMDRWPWARRRVLRALASDPELFPKLLALHVGALRPRQLGVSGTAALAWQMLTA